MGSIFISYRREDTAGHAGRLYDRLNAAFGKEQVFMDMDSIGVGADFVSTLQEKIKSCYALIALIGPQWLTSRGDDKLRRLDDPGDFVRLEISTALNRQIAVIPVLVGGVVMPSAKDLPADLVALARRQAIEVSDTRFHEDVTRLIETLNATLKKTEILEIQDITGKWTASVKNDLGHVYHIYLNIETFEDEVFGWVLFPTGKATIQQGTIEGRRLSFVTEHVPQFETEKATTRFKGKISATGIEMYLRSESSSAKFTAVRES
jgi:hypothetical protein